VGLLRHRSRARRAGTRRGRDQPPAHDFVCRARRSARVQPRRARARAAGSRTSVRAPAVSPQADRRRCHLARGPRVIFGWDLGGAHVKLAVLDAAGNLARVAQVPCPLWLGLEHLERALRESAGAPGRARHALTMTGELVDLFPDRATGVAEILATFQRVVEGCEPLVFAGDRFLAAPEAKAAWSDVASANWLASAVLAAAHLPAALVLDIGSTTTDVTLIADGRVQARGGDDRARLASDELVYSGVVRTPLAAVADRVPFGGEWVGVIAEHFATTGDLYRISGEPRPRFDQSATADGRTPSREASKGRRRVVVGGEVDRGGAAATGG